MNPAPIAVRAAVEGIPVGAIARILALSFGDTQAMLEDARLRGEIVEIPKPDWPPTAKLADRLPALPASPSDADVEFAVQQIFKLTALEAGFLAVLLKHDRVEKLKLHNIVEQKRLTRSSQPNKLESTDPKMVDVMVCKLRKKLKKVDPGFLITTIWGGGYHIVPGVKSAIVRHMTEQSHAQADQSTPAPSAGAGA